MHINSVKQICPSRPFIPLFFPFNIIDKDKSVGNNKKNKPKNKLSINRKESANDNSRNSDNKPSTNMKSFIDEKNIN